MTFIIEDNVIVNTPFTKGEARILFFEQIYCCKEKMAKVEFPSGFKLSVCQSVIKKKE